MVRYALYSVDRGEFVLTQRAGDLAAYFGISVGHMRRLLRGGVRYYRGCYLGYGVGIGRCRHLGRSFF